MNIDEYNEVINGEKTYQDIVFNLEKFLNVIIGWSDGQGTHLDILFSMNAIKAQGNGLQRGIRASDLFVSIMGMGAFGFEKGNESHADYYEEKLAGGRKLGATAEPLAELINNVRMRL